MISQGELGGIREEVVVMYLNTFQLSPDETGKVGDSQVSSGFP
jgi:hypothetical protein